VSNAVVGPAATYCWQQEMQGLQTIKKVILQYFLKFNTNVLNALKKVKTLTKIRLIILNHFSRRQPKQVSLDIAALYSRCKPPGRRRSTIFSDFDFFSLRIPHPSTLVRPSDGFLVAGNRSRTVALNRLSLQSSYFSWLRGEIFSFPANLPADNYFGLLEPLTGVVLLFPELRDIYLKRAK
jgi:hypothetical protein